MRLLKKVKRNLNSDANIALKKWNTKIKTQKTSKKNHKQLKDRIINNINHNLGVPLLKKSGRAVRSRFPMKNRESSTAIPHANPA